MHERVAQPEMANSSGHPETKLPAFTSSDQQQHMEMNGGTGGRRAGRCKWFNVVKGYGFLTPHDGGQDVFVHQSVIQMPGFRSVGEGEEVEFESRPSEKGVEATFVCGLGGTDCKGSERRPVSRKKFRKIRCYNCGDFANHIAAKCPHGPLPKRCHHCKSEDHLIADCPSRKGDQREEEDDEEDEEEEEEDKDCPDQTSGHGRDSGAEASGRSGQNGCKDISSKS